MTFQFGVRPLIERLDEKLCRSPVHAKTGSHVAQPRVRQLLLRAAAVAVVVGSNSGRECQVLDTGLVGEKLTPHGHLQVFCQLQ